MDLNLILLGPPGVGKGTQAARLQELLGLPWISTGEILRANVRDKTPLGEAAAVYVNEGGLVPDEVVTAMTIDRLDRADAGHGFILDGFPRTVSQAEALARQLAQRGRRISAALLISLPDAEIVSRIAGRRVCAAAGHSYHVEHGPSSSPGRCDEDGSELIQREDDKPGVVARRLSVYHELTAPLADFYLERGLLRQIDGSATPEEVHARIRLALEKLS